MFEDRVAAGRALAAQLTQYKGRDDLLVLALPRGGVPVAAEVARALGAPLDVLIVRKLGLPHHPELAMGAIASGGALYVDRSIMGMSGVGQAQLQAVLERETAELQRREALYRGGRPPLRVAGRTVIVVDDGMATGATLRAALAALRALKPARLVAAVPVAPADGRVRMADLADEFVCVLEPPDFAAVGQFYRQFDQTQDDEVRRLLAAPAA